jgi:hypothetical protein
LPELSFPPYEIVVEFVSEGDVANLLRGYISVGGEKVRFTGVAYGRFGGQNVSPQLSPAARKKLRPLVGDLEKFEEDLQQRLVKGQFESRPGPGEKHAHVHLGEGTPHEQDAGGQG